MLGNGPLGGAPLAGTPLPLIEGTAVGELTFHGNAEGELATAARSRAAAGRSYGRLVSALLPPPIEGYAVASFALTGSAKGMNWKAYDEELLLLIA